MTKFPNPTWMTIQLHFYMLDVMFFRVSIKWTDIYLLLSSGQSTVSPTSRKSCDWAQHHMLYEIWAAIQSSPIGGLLGLNLTMETCCHPGRAHSLIRIGLPWPSWPHRWKKVFFLSDWRQWHSYHQAFQYNSTTCHGLNIFTIKSIISSMYRCLSPNSKTHISTQLCLTGK